MTSSLVARQLVRKVVIVLLTLQCYPPSLLASWGLGLLSGLGLGYSVSSKYLQFFEALLQESSGSYTYVCKPHLRNSTESRLFDATYMHPEL